ncbi:MAG: hypothetical protein HYY04_12505 [Chloroflexi bacterium]|nr:hypothetical protein [Chloroflexota bacterium]
MRRGRFEEEFDPNGQKIYRLRWVEERPLSEFERARRDFVRYLVQTGKLNEGAAVSGIA